MKLILGSSSILRVKILKNAGLDFVVVDPNVKQQNYRSSVPEILVSQLALLKAQAIAKTVGVATAYETVILTSDQVIVCDGQILEKPLDDNGQPSRQKVMANLIGYATHPAIAITSVLATNLKTHETWTEVDRSSVKFRKLTQTQMEQIAADPHTYLAAGSLPTGIAESTASQILRAHIDEWLEGDETGFMGLPMALSLEVLRRVGYMRSMKRG